MASVSPPTPLLPLSSSPPPLTPDETRPRRRRRHDRTLPLSLKLKNYRNTDPGTSSDEASDVPRPPKHQSRRKAGRNSIRKSISPPSRAWGQQGLIRQEINDPTSYHLKWDNHLSSTLSEIQDLLANEMFVDVTLVCEEAGGEGRPKHHRLRAHKAILSNCSRYFEQMLRENPCKHPVIVLKDFQRWEVEALLDFMYRGQVMVRPERIETLLKAADALQVSYANILIYTLVVIFWTMFRVEVNLINIWNSNNKNQFNEPISRILYKYTCIKIRYCIFSKS